MLKTVEASYRTLNDAFLPKIINEIFSIWLHAKGHLMLECYHGYG